MGFRMIEKSNWAGLGLVSAGADFLDVRRRKEWSRPSPSRCELNRRW